MGVWVVREKNVVDMLELGDSRPTLGGAVARRETTWLWTGLAAADKRAWRVTLLKVGKQELERLNSNIYFNGKCLPCTFPFSGLGIAHVFGGSFDTKHVTAHSELED